MRPIFLIYLFFRNNNENLSYFKTNYLSKKKKNDVNYYLAPRNLYKLLFNNTNTNNSKNEIFFFFP